ncbi:MAG: glycosyltransferase [Acidimicrobiales bacterium]
MNRRLLTAAAALMLARFAGYVTTFVLPVVRHRPNRPGDARAFEWHFLIPCLDEAVVIERTVRELTATMPAAEVWCIDDASVDGTPEILDRLAARHPKVHVVRRHGPEARRGKGPVLNAGWRAIVASIPADTDLDRVIVGVIDADGILDPECPAMISGTTFLGDPLISAVQIKVRIFEDDMHLGGNRSRRSRFLARMQDLDFTSPIAGMQMFRRRVGTCGLGGTGQFTRLSSLSRVAGENDTPWRRSLLEDFELGLHILLTGGRTDYCHDTWVAQEAVPTVGGLIRQRSRWIQGTIQCSRYLGEVWRSPWISRAGKIEITKFLAGPWLQMCSDVGALVLLATLLARPAGGGVFPGAPGAGTRRLITLFVLLTVARRVPWGPIYRHTQAPDLSRSQAWTLGVANSVFAPVHDVACWWALVRILRGRDGWKKTRRLGARPL